MLNLISTGLYPCLRRIRVGPFHPRCPRRVLDHRLPDLDQVRRETLAGVLALEDYSLEVDLSCAVVILRNDAFSALAALSKGSSSSTFLYQCAMQSCSLQRQICCSTYCLHAPGRVLVDEGVDCHSRDGALEVAGPVVSEWVRSSASQLGANWGWTLTVDAFASESNTVVPRNFARYDKPAAEAEDAFTVLDWYCSACPSCGLVHRYTLFPHPSSSIISSPELARTKLAQSSFPPWLSLPRNETSCSVPRWSRIPKDTSACAANRSR
jgi:hypothetical protein